ncbi:Domain of unknown function DUF1794 [Acidimicrobium ferrooxidans DSM 10331]|uniref:THAP4-like heme-binding domain-containing protein n=1 Tax=Acidimicrobium ferrooxidans (strain DSM 10331 / JCM 15462 / NBRC 103882 / ICP) TaxID=525909 RepID=C7LZP0_ACIFD|nr:FABP family protein [Acidimicrobium ferrooxidans]ACU54198.1 Domain of unknown function DUF1794 [Acidimicrobium ferrooxidans DSM 10331]
MTIREMLEGTWTGSGIGSYPEVAEFSYQERLRFESNGRPFLRMEQHTTGPDGSPLHTEVGYLRFVANGRLELVVAQPTGIVEVLEGGAEEAEGGVVISLTSLVVATTPSAKRVDAVQRRFTLRGDELMTELWMDAMERGMHQHLESRLRRG